MPARSRVLVPFKSQLTLRYENGKPVGCTSVVLSTQHDEEIEQAEVREIVRPFIEATLPDGWMCAEEEFYVNPTGRFVIGGPDSDAGLTGRKIIVDTYGGAALMVAVLFPAKIRVRLTGRLRMVRAMWQRMLLRLASPKNVLFKLRMLLVYRNRLVSMLIRWARLRFPKIN